MTSDRSDTTDCGQSGPHGTQPRPTGPQSLRDAAELERRVAELEHLERAACRITEERPECDTDTADASARASYRDGSYPERECDRCHKPYRGPAVYCSLGCAVTDA